MLVCSGDRLYTGITTDLERRLNEHNAGRKGARFTRANRPVKLLTVKRVKGRSAALKLEVALKKLTCRQKLSWADENPIPETVSASLSL